MKKGRIRLFLLILPLFLLAACGPIYRIEQPNLTAFVDLSNNASIGQTFTSRYAGLNGIVLYLQPTDTQNGQLVLHLRCSPTDPNDIRTATLPLNQLTSSQYVRFSFPAVPESAQADYYLLVKLRGQGSVQVGISSADTYFNGALYQNNQPLDGQLTFQLTHDRWRLGLGLLWEFGRWLVLSGVAAFLFILPGWGLLSYLWQNWDRLHWLEKIALAGGVSLVTYPLLMLWSWITGWKLGTAHAWLPPLAGLILTAWHWRADGASDRIPSLRQRLKTALSRPDFWAEFFLGAMVLLLIATRLWAIRALDAPMWGDSYLHTVIAQLIVDHGGLFSDWRPYAELTTMTYHFGFHSLLAVFHWVTQLEMYKVTLIMGQIINILAVISLVPLAFRLSRNPWAAAFTILAAGLLMPLPMVYTNWGRYTQLTGQVILPVAICLAWDEVSQESWRVRQRLLIGLLVGGLALTHYRVVLLLAAAFPALALVRQSWSERLQRSIDLALSGTIGLILVFPWLLQVLAGKLGPAYGDLLAQSATQPPTLFTELAALGDLSRYLPGFVWLLIPAAIAWGLWRRNPTMLMLALWWLLEFGATNPNLFSLPGGGVITNFTLLISIYIPVGLAGGGLAGWSAETLATVSKTIRFRGQSQLINGQPYLQAGIVLVLIVLAAYAARMRLYDINPNLHAMVTRPDLRAAGWIKSQTPPDSRFLINGQFAYGGYVVVGTDGGWWLPLLANRQNTVPPLLYMHEEGPRYDYREWLNLVYAQIENAGLGDAITRQLLREHGITHLYLGQMQGRVNDSTPLFDPYQLLELPFLRLVYHQDRVWIFEIQE